MFQLAVALSSHSLLNDKNKLYGRHRDQRLFSPLSLGHRVLRVAQSRHERDVPLFSFVVSRLRTSHLVCFTGLARRISFWPASG